MKTNLMFNIMKKILILIFYILFSNILKAQQATVSISGSSSVEIGIPYKYTFTFNPDIPPGADTYIINEWIITTGLNGNSSTIKGYIGSTSNNGSYYYDGTFNSPNPKTIPIQWGDGSYASYTDYINVRVSGVYRNSKTGANIRGFSYISGTKDLTLQRLERPIIDGEAVIANCNQNNQRYSFSNVTNSDQAQWTVSNGATIVGPATGTSVIVRPNFTGDYVVSCKVKRSGSNPNYSVSSSKTVTRKPFTSNATISGNATFCSSSSYSMLGLLPDQTVVWSLSNPLSGTLSTTTGTTTTLTAGQAQGDVVLIAKITNSCGETTYKTKNITIGVNGLSVVLTTPSGYPYSYPYYNVPEVCSAPLYVFSTSSENTNVNNPTKLMKFICNGSTIIKQPVGNYDFFLYASDFNISEGSSFKVTAFVGNSCGFATNATEFTLYRPTPCECGIGCDNNQLPRIASSNHDKPKSGLKLYPNPSNDVIKIELDTTTITNSKALVYNMLGAQVDSFNILENKGLLDVKNYNKGMYILKINVNGEVQSHQIIVK
jgi:hypothetical protein